MAEIRLDVPYGRQALQTFDFYLADKVDAPVLLFIHGGAWISGDKSEYTAVGQRFAAQGIGFAAINYRLSPDVRHPAHVEDVRTAYKRVIEINPLAFVAGHSVGAFLAASIASEPKTKAPLGFIGLEGIYDVHALDARWPAYREWFLNKAFESPGDWTDASPGRCELCMASPWLLIHSRQDELVDVGQTSEFAKHLAQQSIDAELELLDEGTHDEVVVGLSSTRSEAANLIAGFIRRLTG